jgi:hypothetical protein
MTQQTAVYVLIWLSGALLESLLYAVAFFWIKSVVRETVMQAVKEAKERGE